MKLSVKYILGGLLLVAVFLFIAWRNGSWPFTKIETEVTQADVAKLPVAPEFKNTDVVLFFSPHPDDESLSSGGTIIKAIKAGAQVYICWMCAGDGFEADAALLTLEGHLANLDTLFWHNAQEMLDLGRIRIAEAHNAGLTLGLPYNHLIFMGLGDGTPTSMFVYPDSVITSSYSKVSKGPYDSTIAYQQNYTGRFVEKWVWRLIDSLKPTIVYAPAPLDNQPDHQGTSFFVEKVLKVHERLGMMRNFLVHGGDYIISHDLNYTEYPLPRGLHMEMALQPPIIGNSYNWTKNLLDTNVENGKYAAVLCHVSQMKYMPLYMQAFVRTNELYATLDSSQLGLPRQFYFHN